MAMQAAGSGGAATTGPEMLAKMRWYERTCVVRDAAEQSSEPAFPTTPQGGGRRRVEPSEAGVSHRAEAAGRREGGVCRQPKVCCGTGEGHRRQKSEAPVDARAIVDSIPHTAGRYTTGQAENAFKTLEEIPGDPVDVVDLVVSPGELVWIVCVTGEGRLGCRVGWV